MTEQDLARYGETRHMDVTQYQETRTTSSQATEFLSSLSVVKMKDLWAHQECDICQEPFFKGPEKPLKLPCGHIFGSACIAEWLSPTAVDLAAKNTCPICRAVLFSKAEESLWETTSSASDTDYTHFTLPFLASSAGRDRPAAVAHPELLVRIAEARQVSAGSRKLYGPAAEALVLLRAIIKERLDGNAGRGSAEGIPGSVIDDALQSLAAQMGRLYGYYEWQINKETTSISWGLEGPEVSTLKDPMWARWCEWQLQELVYMERNRMEAILPGRIFVSG